MSDKSETIRIRLTVEGVEIDGAVQVPAGIGPRTSHLPAVRTVTDALVQVAVQKWEETGERVSCRKGCDACCRQMVPLAPTEAHGLAETLEGMDAAVAERVLARFERGLAVLEERGVVERLRGRGGLSGEELAVLDRDYFAAQVACPFLERRACMIHGQRPLACREFLVSSDPRHCASPGSGKVVRVEMPAKPSVALTESDGGGWVPLILAREFTAQHREAVGKASETIRDVLARL